MAFPHDNDHDDTAAQPGESAPYSDRALIEVHQHAREKAEPTEGFAPAPTLIVIFICTLASFCFFYLEHNTHGFSPSVFDNEQKDTGGVAAAAAPVVETLEMRLKKGGKIFNQICASCHQTEGQGVPGTYPPLAGSPYVEGDPARAISIVLAGLSGPIEVLGNPYSGTMPEHGSSLKDKQIADVLTYVRQSWGHKQEPISVEQVAEVRKAIGKRGPWTAPELLAAHPLEKQ